MGQYYKPVILDDNSQIEASWCAHDYGDGLKLTEHSYVGNDFLAAVFSKLHATPSRLIWAGDYGKFEDRDLFKEADDFNAGFTSKSYDHENWVYAVNHDKRTFARLNNKDNKGPFDLTFSPLPILTAVGNGQGGGDYFGPNSELAGTWAGDHISIVRYRGDFPKSFTELKATFTET